MALGHGRSEGRLDIVHQFLDLRDERIPGSRVAIHQLVGVPPEDGGDGVSLEFIKIDLDLQRNALLPPVFKGATESYLGVQLALHVYRG